LVDVASTADERVAGEREWPPRVTATIAKVFRTEARVRVEGN
jgi:hypothetical protein